MKLNWKERVIGFIISFTIAAVFVVVVSLNFNVIGRSTQNQVYNEYPMSQSLQKLLRLLVVTALSKFSIDSIDVWSNLCCCICLSGIHCT